jgi:hypothetical protein
MANCKTDVKDDVSPPLPYEDRTRFEKSIKAAPFLEQIAQFSYKEARA